VLDAARCAPSGSDIQPWNIYVLTGAPLAQLKKLATDRVAAGDPWDEREYVMYPPDMPFRTPSAELRSAGIATAHSRLRVRTRRRV
jgi:nitroreductase